MGGDGDEERRTGIQTNAISTNKMKILREEIMMYRGKKNTELNEDEV